MYSHSTYVRKTPHLDNICLDPIVCPVRPPLYGPTHCQKHTLHLLASGTQSDVVVFAQVVMFPVVEPALGGLPLASATVPVDD